MNVKESEKQNTEASHFHDGTARRAQEYLGAHLLKSDGGKYVYAFRTFAKRASSVALAGDFNFWGAFPMHRVSEEGIYELIYESDIPLEGMRYKYKIFSSGEAVMKKDPFARYGEWVNGGSSIVFSDTEKYEWQDKKWIEKRKSLNCEPLNIYELHLGSWKTRGGKSTGDGKAYLDYREIAGELCTYAREMGYTHVCLLPIAEYSESSPRGFATESYFAPSGRFGNPDGFKYFVDTFHKSGIGVICELPLLKFSSAADVLFEFDGYRLYETEIAKGNDKKNRDFDLLRAEVRSFLMSAVLFWLREYHIDGIFVGDISSIYKNGRSGEERSEVSDFFRALNSAVSEEFPYALMIAGETGGHPLVSAPAEGGGLGFSFKLNCGWARDAQNYCATDPYIREKKHRELTFSLKYAFGENYILPISCEDVSDGRGTLLDKIFGSYEDKFATARVFLGYMMAHPGKKLIFMGTEFGQFREWDDQNQLEWFLTDFESHKALQNYVRELNSFYLAHGALWEMDLRGEGFSWICEKAKKDNMIAFFRRGNQKELVCIMNFSPAMHKDYVFDLKKSGRFYQEVLNSDSEKFGGKGRENRGLIECISGEIRLDIPPLSAIFLEEIENVQDEEITVEIK